jgi:hypothetical protein
MLREQYFPNWKTVSETAEAGGNLVPGRGDCPKEQMPEQQPSLILKGVYRKMIPRSKLEI